MGTSFSEDELLWYMAQLALMLKVLKENWTIHRDINPCAIAFKTPDPNDTILKLGHFGSSKKFEEGTMMTKANTTIKNGGYARFKAPELFNENEKRYGSKADVWAAGMCMY